jgi:hypothetical protein
MVGVTIGPGGVVFDALADVKVHPAAELFPLMEGEQFDELVEDIRQHGLREPIAFTPDHELLDGRNRYRACKKLDAEPQWKTVEEEPWAYVISTNMRRRHLTNNQRKMIGARLAERMRGRPRKKPAKAGLSEPAPLSHEQAAELLNVTVDGIERARTVVTRGTKALQMAVDEDRVTIGKAQKIARVLSPEKQDQWVAKVNAGANPRTLPLTGGEGRPLRHKEPSKRNNISPHRHRYVGYSAIERAIHVGEGLSQVLKTASDGLDPSITSEEATQLVDGLSKSADAHRRTLTLLRERIKESSST